MSLPVPDQGGQVAGELLLAGRHRGGPGPECREALPGMDAADALGTGQQVSDSNKPFETVNQHRGGSQGTLSHPHDLRAQGFRWHRGTALVGFVGQRALGSLQGSQTAPEPCRIPEPQRHKGIPYFPVTIQVSEHWRVTRNLGGLCSSVLIRKG